MANILITGISGTLGKMLAIELRRRGHEVWGADLQHREGEQYIRTDVRSYRQLERVFEQPFEFVYHLAAEFGRINGEEYYDTLWESNVVGTRNILELQRRHGFKLIFSSSSEIYGDVVADILHEDLPMERPTPKPLHSVGVSSSLFSVFFGHTGTARACNQTQADLDSYAREQSER